MALMTSVEGTCSKNISEGPCSVSVNEDQPEYVLRAALGIVTRWYQAPCRSETIRSP
jgi:hypothetical protein